LTGADHEAPWSVDLTNTTLKPLMYTAYTSPVAGTTSMIGSNWPPPLQAHNGAPADQVAPPSALISMAMCGVGQLPGHGLSVP
jgi:hypothetical protein